MDGVTNFMLLAAAQYSFLQFFGTAAAVMLPVGIFLRSFSFTRKIGGVVLAAVIASAVLYPSGFIVSKEIYNTYRGGMMAKAYNIRTEATGNPPAASVVCSPFMQRFAAGPLPFVGGEVGWMLAICTPICLIPVVGQVLCVPCMEFVKYAFYIVLAAFPLIVFFGSLWPFANRLGASELIGGYYHPLRDFALPAVAEFSVLSIVVFLIPLIIAMVMLRNLAITFGGEPQLYGISRLI
jgi:hypothetical protein